MFEKHDCCHHLGGTSRGTMGVWVERVENLAALRINKYAVPAVRCRVGSGHKLRKSRIKLLVFILSPGATAQNN